MFQHLLVLFCFFAFSANANYYHLELGAGNYGQEGHTRSALYQTYAANLVRIANRTSFFEKVAENAAAAISPLVPKLQYQVLFKTLDKLVQRNPGETIVFFVNDLVAEWSQYAAEKLQEYAAEKKYDVLVINLPGNYFELDIATALSAFDTAYFDSVHLKNPELMYSDVVEGNNFFVTDLSRKRMREGLQKVANFGKRGLHFFFINNDYYFPGKERIEYAMRGRFYENTTEWQGFEYNLPDASWKSSESNSHVFFISRRENF